MNKFRRYLTQRYPFEENKWKTIIPITIFVAFFIIIFQPFGLSEWRADYKHLFLLGYGMVTFIILVIDLLLLPVLFPKMFGEEKWTVIKEILYFLIILFTIGLGNLLYSNQLMEFRFSITNIIIFQGFTLAIGIIPITAITLIKQNYLSRKNVASAEEITSALPGREPADDKGHQVRICSDNEKEFVETRFRDLLFVRSEGNYITVGHLKNGRMETVLLRNTLKYAEELFASTPFIFKCHRSWLVNLNRISKVSGNSQGLRIRMEGFDEEIPVARKITAEFRKLITRNQT